MARLTAGPFAFNPLSLFTLKGDHHVRIPSALPSPPPHRQALRLARPPRRAVLFLPPPHPPPPACSRAKAKTACLPLAHPRRPRLHPARPRKGGLPSHRQI